MTRSLISALLALILALTSQSMAVTRGAAAATDQMVLCTGTGPIAIYVDAQGNPTSAPHICPDAALNVVLAPAHPLSDAPLRISRFDTPLVQAIFVSLERQHPSPPSRAPPLSV